MYYVNFLIGLAAPLAMLAIGLAWKRKPPVREGSRLAYRTALSERTQETWDFAHNLVSRLWIRMGGILIILTIVLVRFWVRDNFTLLLWVMAGQMALLCCSAFFVDTFLKTAFDEDGHRL